MLSIRYGGSIQQIFWACFSSTTVAGMCVVILLLGVDRFEWTREKCVLCVLTSAFYLLLKNLGVLVKIAMYLTRNHISTILYNLLTYILPNSSQNHTLPNVYTIFILVACLVVQAPSAGNDYFFLGFPFYALK